MTGDEVELELRRAARARPREAERLLARKVVDPSQPTVTRLFTVVDGGHLPTTTPAVFQTTMKDLGGLEVEGVTPALSGLGLTAYVTVLGGPAPAAGDILKAHEVYGRWVAAEGGGSTSGGPGTPCSTPIRYDVATQACSLLGSDVSGLTVTMSNGSYTATASGTGNQSLFLTYPGTYSGTAKVAGYGTLTWAATVVCGTNYSKNLTFFPDTDHVCCPGCTNGISKKQPLYLTDANGTWPLPPLDIAVGVVGTVGKSIGHWASIDCEGVLPHEIYKTYQCHGSGGSLNYNWSALTCGGATWSAACQYYTCSGPDSGCPVPPATNNYSHFYHGSTNNPPDCDGPGPYNQKVGGSGTAMAVSIILTGSCSAGSVFFSGTVPAWSGTTPDDGHPVPAGSTVVIHD